MLISLVMNILNEGFMVMNLPNDTTMRFYCHVERENAQMSLWDCADASR